VKKNHTLLVDAKPLNLQQLVDLSNAK
jgi:hypothetical protein